MRTSLILLLLGGCSAAPDVPDLDPQDRALAQLEADTRTRWHVRYHDALHTPAFLVGRTAPLLSPGVTAAHAARGFLTAYRELFRIAAPDLELTHDGTDLDGLGMSHARFHQHQSGVPVWNGELSAHFDAHGALLRIHGRYFPLPVIDLTPVTTGAQGTARAIALVSPGLSIAARITTSPPQLVIDPLPLPGSPPRLAWRIEVAIEDAISPAAYSVFVDSVSGQPYRSEQLLDDLSGSGSGVFGAIQTLEIAERHGRFYLENSAAGSYPQKTYSAAGGARLPGRELSSERADRWDEADPGQGAAVDAHAYVTATQDYFAKVHGRDGWADRGRGMRSVVHFGQRFNNAFWDGKQLVFGDGDGKTFAPLSGALDVVAHEFTHAVTQASTHLGHQAESGALNEAISDLFGCFIERRVHSTSSNWTVGEQIYRPGYHTSLRDLLDPHHTGNPAHIIERIATEGDRGGVHINSTIASHAGYLMAEGGTNSVSREHVKAIGSGATELIWYRALTTYLGRTSGFRDAADATIAAAVDLFGSGEKAVAVKQAWHAVGISN